MIIPFCAHISVYVSVFSFFEPNKKHKHNNSLCKFSILGITFRKSVVHDNDFESDTFVVVPKVLIVQNSTLVHSSGKQRMGNMNIFALLNCADICMCHSMHFYQQNNFGLYEKGIESIQLDNFFSRGRELMI